MPTGNVWIFSILIFFSHSLLAQDGPNSFPQPDFEMKSMDLGPYKYWKTELDDARRLTMDFDRQYLEKYMAAYKGTPEQRAKIQADKILEKWNRRTQMSTSAKDLFPNGQLFEGPPPLQADLDRAVILAEELPPSATVGRIYPNPSFRAVDLPAEDYVGYTTKIDVLKRRMRDFLTEYASEFALEFENMRRLPAGFFNYKDLLAVHLRNIEKIITFEDSVSLEANGSLRKKLLSEMIARARKIDETGYPNLMDWFSQALKSRENPPPVEELTEEDQTVISNLEARVAKMEGNTSHRPNSDLSGYDVELNSAKEKLLRLQYVMIFLFALACGISVRKWIFL